ncbi:hypothetical protein [Pelosinus baikalensis]|uniref:hypothetical protein n=1 Tax=Pelosinus baikalensis TaxID=2892015 RepID=UPI001E46BB0E|nr:hypothetical protein [Pelosinus baikalensis]
MDFNFEVPMSVSATPPLPNYANESLSSSLVFGNDNGTPRSVDVDFQGNIVQIPAATKHSQQGELFSAVPINTYLIGLETCAVLQLINPANSGKTFRIERIIGGTSPSLITNNTLVTLIEIYKNGAPIPISDPITPVNRNWGSPNTSVATANLQLVPVFAITSNLLQTSLNTLGYFEFVFNEELIIPSSTSDQNISIAFINLNPSAGIIITASIVWSET